ncbi:MAG TPA: imidazolonepropionase [Phycisphaerae bacterium]|nr:imidazolonepropionase [Phycisphaerae bacterium]HNU45089.1 imidazolonepropionase [Phycisphaerae bacterium]
MLAIRNINELLIVPPGPVPGRAMRHIETLRSAAVLLDDERIAWFGPDADCDPPAGCPTLDAAGGCVLPGLIDCHTHTVFAGARADEFVRRLEGATYAQIAEAGGGIRRTVEAVRAATGDGLVALAQPRIQRMLANGVTTLEIKSGYGLNVDDELKMLLAIRRLQAHTPVELVATYLAAHTTPRERAGRADEYLDTVLAPAVLARIRDERLAEFCDVFCERTAFTVEQARRVLTTARQYGLIPRLHADQITQMGASALAAEVGALSADHLETIDDGGIDALKRAGTVPVLLPGCSFFLGVEQAPARRLLEADLPVALATDHNPGSCMIESLPLVMGIACTQMRLTPTEVVVAATANAAAALNRRHQVGAIAVGMQADLVVLDVPDHQSWMYELGRNCVRSVVKKGKVVVGLTW